MLEAILIAISITIVVVMVVARVPLGRVGGPPRSEMQPLAQSRRSGQKQCFMVPGAGPVNYPWYIPREGCGATRSLVLEGDFYGAIAELERLAALGSRPSQAALGYLYLRKTGLFEPDFSRARRYVETAAATGYPYAQYVMGWLALKADRDLPAATRHWQDAANRGFAAAALDIGRFYAQDFPGKPPNVAGAFRWYKRARLLGHRSVSLVRAQFLMTGAAGRGHAWLARCALPLIVLADLYWWHRDPFSEKVFLHVNDPTWPLFNSDFQKPGAT